MAEGLIILSIFTALDLATFVLWTVACRWVRYENCAGTSSRRDMRLERKELK